MCDGSRGGRGTKRAASYFSGAKPVSVSGGGGDQKVSFVSPTGSVGYCLVESETETVKVRASLGPPFYLSDSLHSCAKALSKQD